MVKQKDWDQACRPPAHRTVRKEVGREQNATGALSENIEDP